MSLKIHIYSSKCNSEKEISQYTYLRTPSFSISILHPSLYTAPRVNIQKTQPVMPKKICKIP